MAAVDDVADAKATAGGCFRLVASPQSNRTDSLAVRYSQCELTLAPSLSIVETMRMPAGAVVAVVQSYKASSDFRQPDYSTRLVKDSKLRNPGSSNRRRYAFRSRVPSGPGEAS